MKISLLALCSFLLSGCAVLHHIQLGNVDNRNSVHLRPIEIKVSEIGIDLNDARTLAKLTMNSGAAQQTNDALRFVEYFQMGPHTGAGVYSLDYIKEIQNDLRNQCTDGYLTGIMAIRETRKYPVISGEIVKIKAYCAVAKGA